MRLNSSRDEDAASSLERFFVEEEGNFLLSLSPAYVNVRCAECSLEDLWSSRCSRGVMMKRHEGFLKEYATQNLFSYQLLPEEKMFAQRAWDGT